LICLIEPHIAFPTAAAANKTTTAAKQPPPPAAKQSASNQSRSSAGNPLAKIPVIGKLFGK
jgi:hypothetical protein